jgi:class 3 adenylate cyclase
VGDDEEGTLERLRAIRKELIDPVIAAHRGRIVKTTGDGLLGARPDRRCDGHLLQRSRLRLRLRG